MLKERPYSSDLTNMVYAPRQVRRATSGSLEPSHVLRAMGIPFTAIHGSIRFSLSRYNTEAEIDTVIEIMPEIIKELRLLSPFGRDKLDQCIKCT